MMIFINKTEITENEIIDIKYLTNDHKNCPRKDPGSQSMMT